MTKNKIIILSPYLNLPGGVSSFVNSLKGKWSFKEIYCFRGGYNNNYFGKLVYFFIDYLLFIFKVLLYRKSAYVLINTSLNKSAFFRDRIFFSTLKFLKIEFNVFIHGWNNLFFSSLSDFYFSGLFGAKNIFVLSEIFKYSLISKGCRSNISVETTVVDDDFANSFTTGKVFKEGQDIQILFLGRLEPEKGIFSVLNSFRNICQSYSNVSLKIAGTGSSEEDVVNWINSNCDLDVKYIGHVTGLNKSLLFKDSHIYVLPSESEGLPISVLEAYSAGCIVLVTKVGGIPSIFSDRINGFEIESNTINSVRDSFFRSFKYYYLFNDISMNNFLIAKQRFSSSQLIKRISNQLN